MGKNLHNLNCNIYEVADAIRTFIKGIILLGNVLSYLHS